jgi:hypothetical protein
MTPLMTLPSRGVPQSCRVPQLAVSPRWTQGGRKGHALSSGLMEDEEDCAAGENCVNGGKIPGRPKTTPGWPGEPTPTIRVQAPAYGIDAAYCGWGCLDAYRSAHGL